MFVVFAGLEPEQRELKAVLAIPCFCMADARITARLGQDRHHFVDEADPSIVGRFKRWGGEQTDHRDREADETSYTSRLTELVTSDQHYVPELWQNRAAKR